MSPAENMRSIVDTHRDVVNLLQCRPEPIKQAFRLPASFTRRQKLHTIAPASLFWEGKKVRSLNPNKGGATPGMSGRPDDRMEDRMRGIQQNQHCRGKKRRRITSYNGLVNVVENGFDSVAIIIILAPRMRKYSKALARTRSLNFYSNGIVKI